MAKKRSIKSYLMMSKNHQKTEKPKSSKKSQNLSQSQDNFIMTTTPTAFSDNISSSRFALIGNTEVASKRSAPSVTNSSYNQSESIQTSTNGDLSSGYLSGHTNGASTNNQDSSCPDARLAGQQDRSQGAVVTSTSRSSTSRLNPNVMVNEIKASSHLAGTDTNKRYHLRHEGLWPVMIDDESAPMEEDDQLQHELDVGQHMMTDNDNTPCNNKVHLIDGRVTSSSGNYNDANDNYDEQEDNNNISSRFHLHQHEHPHHRYCVDSKSLASSCRYDESLKLERQIRQQHKLHNSHHHQYFHHRHHHHHQQQQPPSVQATINGSQFEPYQSTKSNPHRSLLLNGSRFGQQQQYQSIDLQHQSQHGQRSVNYLKQPTEIFAAESQRKQFNIPAPNYIQQQYHTLVQYHPHQQATYQQHIYKPTSTRNHQFLQPIANSDSSGFERSSGSGDNSSITSLAYIASLPHPHHHQVDISSTNYLSQLDPSVIGGSAMQAAGSRQHLTQHVEPHNMTEMSNPQSHLHHHHHHSANSTKRHKMIQNGKAGTVAKGVAGKIKRSGQVAPDKPALNCLGKLAKLLLFMTNILFWCAGIALGAWGILSLVEDHKYNLSHLLVFEPSSRMSLFQLLSWSFITLGCATILVGFCGCSAILKNNRWILGLYIFLVLAVFALDLATGLLAIIFQEKLVANVRLRLANKLRSDYGVQASFTAAIDYIQTRFECCGLDGHFDYDQSVWRLQRLGGFEATVARTCCHLRNTFDDQAHINPRPVNESMCQSTDIRFHQSYRYRKGCLDDLERLIRSKIWTFTLGCTAVGGVILISLMFATCFCRSISNYNSRKSSSSSSNVSLSKQEKLHTARSGKLANPLSSQQLQQISTGHRQYHR